MNLVQQPDTDTEDSTGEGTDTEDNTGEDTDTDPNTTDLTNSPGSADAEAIRAAITRGSMTGPPAPMGITITRNHSAPPTIGIRSNVSGDWSDAGPAPVASGTRHYDGYRLTRHAGGGKETAWVWTDVQPPSAKDFDQVYELDTDTNNDMMDDALAVVESEHLDLVTHIGRDPNDMRADDHTSVNPVERGVLGENRTFDEGHRISARFDGAYGIYICIAAPCSIDMTGEGGNPLQGMAGWAFMPEVYTGEEGGTRKPQILVPDSDYRYFGLWLRGPDDDNEGRFDIQTFNGGSERFSGNVTALTGRATYIGPAGGQYVKDTANGSARRGLFTAKVTLHADFGTSPKISGSMGGFRDGGRDLGWNLRFEEDNITTQGTFDGRTSGSTYAGGGDGIGGPDNTGTWSGAFYGNGDDGYPNGAVGAFTGRFNDGLVIGGFGANREITSP